MGKGNKNKKDFYEHCPSKGTAACSDSCFYRNLLSIISRKYTLNVLRVIMENDVARFNKIVNKIVNEISGNPKTITDRLNELCEEGILKRISYAEIPPRVEYSLTEKGKDLEPLFKKIRE